MIDLHCHILPGVDDGAADLQQSMAMVRLAAAEGTRLMVATPHLRHEAWWNEDRALLERRFLELQQAAHGLMELRLGGEIALGSSSWRELEDLPSGSLLTLAGSRYVLLELDRHGLGPDPLDVVHELRLAGWLPILAHPERIAWLTRHPERLEDLVHAGAYVQLTAMSVVGAFGRSLQRLCAELLEAGLVHFVASDAHDERLRPPGLASVRALLVEKHGVEAARRLLLENPAAVVQNQALPRASQQG